MLAAAAVCPCPPVLVPEVAQGAAEELEAVRDACAEALSTLAAARPDRLVVLAPVERAGSGTYPAGSIGGLHGFGVPAEFVLGRAPREDAADGAGGQPPAAARELPAPLTVGAWLLSSVSWRAAPVSGLGVDRALPTEDCLREGRRLAAGEERLALLVLGDGSACRTLKAPGYLDDRAAYFDADAARALADADHAALAALDAALGADLLAAGRAPWQVLAGAAEQAGLSGRLLHDSAPYGVGYLVAAWN
ncbi:class III extradiol dioxygenase subunit B-like domain-containing protein [Streptomyces sp. XM4193]|uniref:class III extradiol dioxygenase subunit B-like domain-containing protein n=1 Tax=Streptomyces sp. XM4193 TaxID=2929782 RepID=UPI001FF94CAB|nr:class III extradiol dioxygenase subunit B-like domain-containing protein [Streptomyces sp. XM4193]MCK1798749.1 class III extradiol dioxygenase subunit B-like domain-containing protein [Streptomyces sp. XM4193]